MKKLFFVTLVCIASALIIVAFFMPWAEVAASVSGISKEVTSSVKDTPFAGKIVGKISDVTDAISEMGDISIKSRVSGFDVPRMANDKTSKVALSLVEVFFKSAENIDMKSYLVYVLPLLAIVCVILAILGIKNKLFVAIMLIISGIVSIGGLYNLYTMDVSSAIVKITIKDGLWYSMYAFMFIFLVSILWLVWDRKKA